MSTHFTDLEKCIKIAHVDSKSVTMVICNQVWILNLKFKFLTTDFLDIFRSHTQKTLFKNAMLNGAWKLKVIRQRNPLKVNPYLKVNLDLCMWIVNIIYFLHYHKTWLGGNSINHQTRKTGVFLKFNLIISRTTISFTKTYQNFKNMFLFHEQINLHSMYLDFFAPLCKINYSLTIMEDKPRRYWLDLLE